LRWGRRRRKGKIPDGDSNKKKEEMEKDILSSSI